MSPAMSIQNLAETFDVSIFLTPQFLHLTSAYTPHSNQTFLLPFHPFRLGTDIAPKPV